MSSNTRVHWAITDHNIIVNYDGQTHIVPRTDGLADRLIKAVKENRLNEIPTLVSAAKRIEKFSRGNFTVQDGDIYVNGVIVPHALGQKILKFSNEGLPYQPLVKFAEKLQQNPSYRAVNELFQFLEKNDHPLTESGNFIAYKRVRKDFKDIHSGTFDNSPGKVLEMPRNSVNEDPTQTCSYGLHVANWDYAHTKFASYDPSTDIMLEVEVSPADVVAVPIDYNQSKMRVCRYKVLGVVDKEHSSDVALRVTDPENYHPVDEDEDFEEDDFCDSCGEELDTCCQDSKCCLCREEEDEEDDYDSENCCEGCSCHEPRDNEDDSDYPFDDDLNWT